MIDANKGLASMNLTKLMAGAATLTLLATPAMAQDAKAQADRIAALEAQVRALADQIAELKTQTAAKPAAPRDKPAAATASLANGRPTLASADGQFTASLRGVFQLDDAHYDQRAPGPLNADFRRGSFGDAVENERARDLGDGANFRRARIGIEGKAFGDFEYNLLYEFGGTGVEDVGRINTAYVQYNGKAGSVDYKLRTGAFAPLAGLEDAASANGLLFAERAAASEMVRSIAGGDGRTAAGAIFNGETWNLSAAVSGNVIGTQTYDEQTAFVGRVAFTPLKGKDWLLHVGANTSIVISPPASGPDVGPAGAITNVRLRERPEMRVDGTRLVDTGSIDADGLTAWGLELGGQRKSLFFQAEYFDIEVERRNSLLSDPSFSGWYVQGGWTITGEPRRYGIATASFDSPRPDKPFSVKDGQWGAWELGLRYSLLDLNYRAGATGTAPVADAVRGGEQEIWTLGLNWYLNSVLRFQAAYQHVDVDRLSPGGSAFVAGSTPPAGSQVGQELNIWSLRTQYAF